MRSVVFAYQDIGYVCLEALLAAGGEVLAVFTHEDDPHETIWFRSVRELSERNGLPVLTPASVKTEAWIGRFRGWAPDFIFSFYYRKMLPMGLLRTARLGALNLHGSLLPRYRGRCPVNWVLVNGERETGVTLHYMEAQADSGDIVAQRPVPIDESDTAATLYGKMTVAAAELFRASYPLLCAGTAPRTPQDHEAATYFGGRTAEDGRISWQAGGRAAYNLVRAVAHPYPGAFTSWAGRRLLIWEARAAESPPGARSAPGTVVALSGGLTIETGDGRLVATRVQLDGEPEMPADEWIQRHGIREGVVLQ